MRLIKEENALSVQIVTAFIKYASIIAELLDINDTDFDLAALCDTRTSEFFN